MVKYKDIKFLTIYSQEAIKNKLDEIISSESLFDKNNVNKKYSGYVNNNGFLIHNKKPLYMYGSIHYWKILVKGIMKNDGNLTNVKIRIRILHGEIIYFYVFFIILSIVITLDGIKSIFPIIFLGIILIIITLSTIFKIKGIDNEMKYHEKIIIKKILE